MAHGHGPWAWSLAPPQRIASEPPNRTGRSTHWEGAGEHDPPDTPRLWLYSGDWFLISFWEPGLDGEMTPWTPNTGPRVPDEVASRVDLDGVAKHWHDNP